MQLLIDNYDSFTYNLFQLIGELTPDVRVIKNDELTVDQIVALHPEHVILSPGPGRPEDAGVSVAVAQKIAGQVPILGVCMGQEVLATAFGGSLKPADHLMHGKPSLMRVAVSPLFKDCPAQFLAARYHSLVVDPDTLPPNFKVTAITDGNAVMAIEDVNQRLYGVQFHPESIMTPRQIGRQIIQNFLAIKL